MQFYKLKGITIVPCNGIFLTVLQLKMKLLKKIIEVIDILKQEQKEKIIECRKGGIQYKEIASRLRISVDQIKYLYRGTKSTSKEKPKSLENCLNCDMPLQHSVTGRKRKFCCAKCRDRYKYLHRDKEYAHICFVCGITFCSTKDDSRFCSRKCVANYYH